MAKSFKEMIFFQKTLKLNSLRFILVAFLLFSASVKISAQNNGEFSLSESPLPAPASPVMDYAGVLDANVKANLEKRIIGFRDSTNPRVELAVAIVRTTGDRPIDFYSLAVARGWKIGSKDDDNPSALLLIAIDDRKYFTQISRDLEDELPDGLAGQLQRQYLVPAFRQGNYGKGITDTIEAYIRTIEGKQSGMPPNANQTAKTEKESKSSLCSIGICIIVIFIILIIVFSRGSGGGGNRNDRDRWRGGGFGGGGGSSNGALPFIVGAILGNALGGGSSGGSSSNDWGGGSSGGDSWGGFGGGGDFGGGGAGGDW